MMDIDRRARHEYLRVLRGLIDGDTLGAPYGALRGVNRARRFVRSGEEYSEATLQEMVRHGLLAIEMDDEEEHVSMTRAGRDFLAGRERSQP